jgi:hypothetical protein
VGEIFAVPLLHRRPRFEVEIVEKDVARAIDSSFLHFAETLDLPLRDPRCTAIDNRKDIYNDTKNVPSLQSLPNQDYEKNYQS